MTGKNACHKGGEFYQSTSFDKGKFFSGGKRGLGKREK
jgi:hypothetical protein